MRRRVLCPDARMFLRSLLLTRSSKSDWPEPPRTSQVVCASPHPSGLRQLCEITWLLGLACSFFYSLHSVFLFFYFSLYGYFRGIQIWADIQEDRFRKSKAVRVMGLWARTVMFTECTVTYWLCDLGQIANLSWFLHLEIGAISKD